MSTPRFCVLYGQDPLEPPYLESVVQSLCASRGALLAKIGLSSIQSPKDPIQWLEALDSCKAGLPKIPTLWVSSGVCGFVMLQASAQETIQGLFLVRPAVGHLPGLRLESMKFPLNYPQHEAAFTALMHGIEDRAIPVANSLTQVQINGGYLRMMQDDETLRKSEKFISAELDHLTDLALSNPT